MRLARFAQWLAGLWAGTLLCIGLLAAPAGFAMLAAQDAGRVAGRMFMQEAYLSLVIGVVLLLIERKRAAADLAPGRARVLTANILLVLGTIFCTIAGYFAVQPMMAAARTGQGAVSFMALHAVSAGFFGLKGLLACVLAWRLSAR